MIDYVTNGNDVAETLMANNFDPRALRPFRGTDDRSYFMHNGKPALMRNATATLRKDDWKVLDDAIVKAAKPRLKMVGDLRSAGLQYTVPNGMGKTVLETETVSDINDADISMDGIRETQGDRPLFELTNMPLPIIHKDFHYSARQIQASRNGGSPLDTTTAELASMKVAEEIEKLTLGLSGTYTYGGGTIYGLSNFTSNLTKTLTTPVGNGSTRGATLIKEVLAMRGQSQAAFHFGPWMIYNSPNWDAVLDEDFKAASDRTVRERLLAIEGISGVRTLDYLENYDLALVQMTSNVVRMVIGMEMTTVQWESSGGLRKHFKVMAIIVPQYRADQNGNTGIVYGSI